MIRWSDQKCTNTGKSSILYILQKVGYLTPGTVHKMNHVVIVGGGPAGLMAAEVLINHGISVSLYEAKASAGRKFLVAGKGGLNITHSEPFDQFLNRYGKRQEILKTYLKAFGPPQLREWLQELGFETFIGSSGRVFPTGMQAAPILRAWLIRLKKAGVNFYFNHRWSGWESENTLLFESKDGSNKGAI